MMLASTDLNTLIQILDSSTHPKEKEMLQSMRGRLGITDVVYESEADCSPRE